jgi:hypothetical protein
MSDLSGDEQENVRAALRFLRVRFGNLESLASVLHLKASSVKAIVNGREDVSARIMLRTARLAEIGLDDLLAGRYPLEGQCAHCGRLPVPGEQSPLAMLPTASIDSEED